MLYSNTDCAIKSKIAKKDGNEYRYIEIGNRENLFFLPCSIKKFDTINAGFHTKLSIGKTKKNNPKIVYTTEDSDLYMILKSEPNQELLVKGGAQNVEILQSVIYEEDGASIGVVLLKILGDVALALKGETESYITVKNKFVKHTSTTKSALTNQVPVC